ncbi:hypothetical protein KEM56_007260 [Ascosphaera pollenicola]|nr:hypothetical protein KEM56_007260 [Ascosphaera pollenicola]
MPVSNIATSAAEDSSSSSSIQHPQHLEPSKLGTKEYWDNLYANSLEHLSDKRRRRKPGDGEDGEVENEASDEEEEDDDEGDNDSDPGTSWFTEHNAPEKVLDFLCSADFPLSPESVPSTVNETTSILDLGTGNGTMLSLLRKEGDFTGPMVGVDYSLQSIELARRLHADDGIRFEVWDVFDTSKKPAEHDWLPSERGGFDVVLDKGTFDAISLSADEIDVPTGNGSETVKRRICELYPEISRRLLRKGGYLIVTSCNWTEEELINWFTKAQGAEDTLTVFGRVEYPKFRFGGREGQGVCTVCFQRQIGAAQ